MSASRPRPLSSARGTHGPQTLDRSQGRRRSTRDRGTKLQHVSVLRARLGYADPRARNDRHEPGDRRLVRHRRRPATPHLIGGKCPQCGTYVFPPRANNCPNPACDGDDLEQVPLSRRGTLWSYTENRYAPPPPYPAPDPFEPFAVAAVELADEGLIVLGKVVDGTLAADLKVGMEMELTTMPLFTDDDGVERVVYAWRIAMSPEPALHPRRRHAPMGQVGPRLHRVRRRRRPGRAERGRPGLAADPAGRRRRHHPQRLPGLHRRVRRSRRSWAGTAFRSARATRRAPAARRRCRAPAPRSWPGSATSRWSSAPTPRPKGFFAPVGGERKNDPDWQRFHLIGATNPVYFALLARRRMDLYGATLEDFAQVKVKNARHGLHNPNARYRKETSVEDVLASPVVVGSAAAARHLRHLRRRGRADRGEREVRPRSTWARSTVCRRCARSAP